MTTRPRVLVTGATGSVGPAVAAALDAAGFPVRAFARTRPSAGLLPGSTEVVLGDLTDPDAITRAVDGCGAVIHLAAELHRVALTPVLEARYRAINIDATARLVEAARAAGVERFVLASTISVYGDGRTAPFSEEDLPHPVTVYGETKLAAERVVMDAAASRFAPVVIRLAAVYGPRVKGNYRRLIRAIARGRFVPVGRGDNRRVLIYVDDAARAAVAAIEHPAAAGEVFNVAGDPIALREIIRGICAALGRRPPVLAIPVFVASLGAGAADAILGGRLHARAAVAKYTEDVAVTNGKIRDRLGFRPAVTPDDGWRVLVAAMRAAGEL